MRKKYSAIMRSINYIRSLEEELFALISKIEFSKYLFNPINYKDEASKFWTKYEKGENYNPQYTYLELQPDQKEAAYELKRLLPWLIQKTRALPLNIITISFLDFLQVEYDELSLLFIERNQNFAENLKSLYKEPPPALIKDANHILITTRPERMAMVPTIISSQFAYRIYKELKKRKLSWHIKEEKGLGSRYSILSSRREIKLKADGKFTDLDFQRFIAHEINTHILRSENGRLQPLKIFSIGLKDYLATEEGLATVMEEKSHAFSTNLLRKYAGRVIAASLVDQSFYDIFCYIVKHFDRQEAHEITHRIKRGLIDTSQPGGLTKDYVYLLGHRQLKEFIKTKKQIKQLYIGKISINHVSDMWSLVEEGILKKPKYLPNFSVNGL